MTKILKNKNRVDNKKTFLRLRKIKDELHNTAYDMEMWFGSTLFNLKIDKILTKKISTKMRDAEKLLYDLLRRIQKDLK